MEEEIKSLYFGSNEYLLDLRSKIDEILEYRSKYKYELFLRIYQNPDIHPMVKTVTYLSDTVELKSNAKQLMQYNGEYHEYKVFLRRLSDNYTIMLGKKIKTSLLELTEGYFKMS